MNRAFCLLLVIVAAACQKQEPPAASVAEPEAHPESYTNWTTKTELFAEYLPLVAGQTSRFSVHLTRLDTFKPVARGRVEIRLTGAAGKIESFTTEGASRPGIFGVDVKPAAAGEFRLSVISPATVLPTCTIWERSHPPLPRRRRFMSTARKVTRRSPS